MCGVFTLEELLSVVRPTETELTTVLYGDAVQVWGLLLPVLGLASREGGEQQSRRYSGVHVWAVSHSALIPLLLTVDRPPSVSRLPRSGETDGHPRTATTITAHQVPPVIFRTQQHRGLELER